jgi:hypothetical protein
MEASFRLFGAGKLDPAEDGCDRFSTKGFVMREK